MVLEYAEGGNFNQWMNKNYSNFDWKNKIETLSNIISGLAEIHSNQMVHRDLHTGNILFLSHRNDLLDSVRISDMGLSGPIGDVDKTKIRKIYGILPYVAPEVLNE